MQAAGCQAGPPILASAATDMVTQFAAACQHLPGKNSRQAMVTTYKRSSRQGFR
jgi:hypothetical protein